VLSFRANDGNFDDSDHEMVLTKRVAAVLVHHGEQGRTVRAVRNHHNLGVFSNIVVVATDLSQRPQDLSDVPCTWLIPDRNLGFGGACQLGAMSCQVDVYAFFNCHVTIDRDSVCQCLAAFDICDVGIVSPYVYYPRTGKPSSDWAYARCVRTYSRVLHLPIQAPFGSNHTGDKVGSAQLIENEWATGAAIFCRYEVIRDIGWVGCYFLGFEDVDLSMRAKKIGWRVVVARSATAFHTGESTRSSTMAAYYASRNQLWFARKHRHRRLQTLLTVYLLVLLCRIAVADVLKKRRPAHTRAAARGIIDGWILWPKSTEALPQEPLWPPKN
jgi:N-acetylglucosaminyl-diphospho-decaprenol L-rhamnosyltransferase